jgi:hypothetical protein
MHSEPINQKKTNIIMGSGSWRGFDSSSLHAFVFLPVILIINRKYRYFTNPNQCPHLNTNSPDGHGAAGGRATGRAGEEYAQKSALFGQPCGPAVNKYMDFMLIILKIKKKIYMERKIDIIFNRFLIARVN